MEIAIPFRVILIPVFHYGIWGISSHCLWWMYPDITIQYIYRGHLFTLFVEDVP